MKKVVVLSILILAMGLVADAAVLGTAHDLSANHTGVGGDQTCVFCHFPHNGNPAVPLWNKTLSAQTYTAYDSATMAAGAGAADWAGNNGSISGLCMSCHDGTLALGSVINSPIAGTINDPGNISVAFAGTTADLGTDLSNDHPVNITYVSGASDEMVALATVQGLATVQLFGTSTNQVECASCHDPHNDTNAPFLVMSNAGSNLCTACHQK